MATTDRCSVYAVMEDHGAWRDLCGVEVFEDEEQIIVGWHEMTTTLDVPVGFVFGTYQDLWAKASERKKVEVR